MNRRLPLLPGLALAIIVPWLFAAEPAPTTTASSTNDLIITCTNGAEYNASMTVFHGDVRVLEPRMYLECDLLTLRFLTNAPPAGSRRGLTNVNARVESIIAETNVMMMARDTTIIGDRAVYTASNEVVEVTGTMVIVDNAKALMYATNFVFNRRTGEGYVVGAFGGRFAVEGGSDGTNAFAPSLGGDRKPKPTPTPK
jgi:lipopolysaccharide assembly outer membrane protein LptD (OstA)